MINAQMREYKYYKSSVNEYGQTILDSSSTGSVKLAVSLISQQVRDNILYHEATYIGLTHDTCLDDTCYVEFNGEKLKVLYVNPFTRYVQVYLAKT